MNIASLRHLRLQPDIYRKIAVIGLPVGAIVILYNLELAAVTALVAAFPSDVSDGYGIGARIMGFLFMANFGVAVGVSVTVGHHLGRGQVDTVQSDLPGFVARCSGVMMLTAAAMFITAPLIIALFTANETAIATGATYLRYMAVTTCLICVLSGFNGAFMGSGRTLPVLTVSALTYLAVELPLILLITRFDAYTLPHIWSAIITATLFSAALTAWLFHRRRWV